LVRGINKIDINKIKIDKDLEKNWAVVAEAIQTILRREKISNPYELLKDLTRGNKEIDKESIKKFISKLPVKEEVRKELLSITPKNYIGNSGK